MRHYEIVVLIGAEQHERGTTMAERYRNMVAEGGGEVHRFEDWGNRRLAYPIGKRQLARYFLFNIECGDETLGKLKDDFRYSESVIRSLVIRREEAIVSDSPMMAEINARGEAREAEEEAPAEEQDRNGKGGGSRHAAASADVADDVADDGNDDDFGDSDVAAADGDGAADNDSDSDKENKDEEEK